MAKKNEALSAPPLSEFIDMDARRERERRRSGFRPIRSDATVAVYDVKGDYTILTIRVQLEAAQRMRLTEGQRLTCHIHPDGTYVALSASTAKRAGSRLFRPQGSRSLVYQTSFKRGLLPPMSARPAEMAEREGVILLTIPQE